jgi:hypothetical protein
MVDLLADYLEGEGFTDVFISEMPDEPKDCIALYDEPGIDEDYMQEYASDSRGVEVLVRGSYTYASNMIWRIHREFLGLQGLENDEYNLRVVRTQTPPAQIEIDNKGRKIYSSHYVALTNAKESGNRQPINQ